MKRKKLSIIIVAAFLLCAALSANAQEFKEQNTVPNEEQSRFAFVPTQIVNVTNVEELYAAINNPSNAGNQIVLMPGIYMLSVNGAGGVARPNGGRLEIQENMSLRGTIGDRGAVVIDAAALPTASYSTPIANTGAIEPVKEQTQSNG